MLHRCRCWRTIDSDAGFRVRPISAPEYPPCIFYSRLVEDARIAMTDSKNDLVDKVRKGDREALAALIECQRPQLRAYIDKNMSATLRQKVDPDDVLQEVVISCLNALDDVDLNDRDPFSWMCQVAQRRIMDAGRKYVGAQKRAAARETPLQARDGSDEHGGLIDLLVASITTPSKAFSRGQREIKLLAAMEQLDATARDALRLRYVEGLPTKQIAEQIGKSDGAIRVLLTRSLKKLAVLLEET